MTATLQELNRKAHEILCRELGPADYVRFFRQFEPGKGDYTRDRWQWLGEVTLNDIVKDARALEEA